MSDQRSTATSTPDPTVERVFSDAMRDHHARHLDAAKVAEFIDHPERCHPDNHLLLISTLAKRLHDELTDDNGSKADPS